MSVGSTTRSIEYDGNDATEDFSTVFYFFASSQLVVSQKTGDDPFTTLVEGVHYTVVLPTVVGGAGVVCLLTAPPTGDTLRIERTVAITQTTDYRGQGSFARSVHENGYDYLTFICQQLADRVAAVEALGDLVPASSYESSIVEAQWTTPADIACPFAAPVNVSMPAGSTVTGVKVVRARNLTDPTASFEEPPQVAWSPNGSGFDIDYCSGLAPSVEYLITLEVTSVADA